ncbi:MAG: nucleotidyltransferase family protein [Syntrophales bacterium]|nr:nucleotidyltransferase family protein [Syntrophales bacterium]
MNRSPGFSALILAAGTSSRMGALKPLLPLGEKTIIEGVMGLFRTAAISDITVVLGNEADRFIPILDRERVKWVINHSFQDGMFSSIQTGVHALDRDCRAFFLLPADMPFVRPATIKMLAASFMEETLFCRPTHQGRRGHPPLISTALIPAILAFEEPGGLRALLATYKDRGRDVDCGDPGILIDLDTPEDYAAYLGSPSPS